MISIIYGHSGSGKTASLIKQANEAVDSAKGIIVYVDCTANHIREVHVGARFVNTTDYRISGGEQFCAFVKGLVAGNYDVEKVYIDHIERITGQQIADLEVFFTQLTDIAILLKISFVLTVNAVSDNPPEFLKQYLA